MKKINWSIVFLSILVILLFIGYTNKDKLNNLVSKELRKQVGNELAVSVEKEVEAKYDYALNGNNFDFTLLEFGSSGCIMCKQMELILEEIKVSKKAKVNVAFLHIMKAENQDLMKYFGISAVPMQILLDRNGKEFFRHYGVISTNDLEIKFIKHKYSEL